MVALLPLEVLQSVFDKFPCRESQIRQLATYYNGIYTSPPLLIVHGLEQTNKLDIVTAVLEARSLNYAIVKSRECLSQRHLLSKIFSTCAGVLHEETNIEDFDRIDSIAALVVNLQRLLEQKAENLVLVLDGIDKQKAAGPTLIPALARLGSQLPNLAVLMISSSPRPLSLHKSGVPYIYFPPFSRTEAIHLLLRRPPPLRPAVVPEDSSKVDDRELLKIFTQFVITVYDAIITSTSSTSINKFNDLCEKLWPKFVWPLFSGEQPPGKTKRWDFARLLIRNRSLFQVEGEDVLTERLCAKSRPWSFEDLQWTASDQPNDELIQQTPSKPLSTTLTVNLDRNIPRAEPQNPPLLKHFSTLLLLSAYLASHTHPKHDIILFSRLSSSSSKKARRSVQKRKMFQSPAKNAGIEPPKTPTKAVKNLLDTRMGLTRPFGLERVVAILRAIHPDGVSNRRGISDRVYRELGELERLRLVTKATIGGEDSEDKWKINVNRDWVAGMGKTWNMGMSEYEMDRE